MNKFGVGMIGMSYSLLGCVFVLAAAAIFHFSDKWTLVPLGLMLVFWVVLLVWAREGREKEKLEKKVK